MYSEYIPFVNIAKSAYAYVNGVKVIKVYQLNDISMQIWRNSICLLKGYPTYMY